MGQVWTWHQLFFLPFFDVMAGAAYFMSPCVIGEKMVPVHFQHMFHALSNTLRHKSIFKPWIINQRDHGMDWCELARK